MHSLPHLTHHWSGSEPVTHLMCDLGQVTFNLVTSVSLPLSGIRAIPSQNCYKLMYFVSVLYVLASVFHSGV